MNSRRNALRLILGGITACMVAPAFANAEIDVYLSPD
jgi:hypothetical protein